MQKAVVLVYKLQNLCTFKHPSLHERYIRFGAASSVKTRFRFLRLIKPATRSPMSHRGSIPNWTIRHPCSIPGALIGSESFRRFWQVDESHDANRQVTSRFRKSALNLDFLIDV